MSVPWCQWCDDIGHDGGPDGRDCPDYQRDDHREDRAQDRITLRDKGEG